MKSTFKMLIVDDHALFIEAIKSILVSLNDGMVFLEAGNSSIALEQVKNNPDLKLVLLDLDIPGLYGTDVLKEIILGNPLLPVIILTGSSHVEDMRVAINAGALGYIHKSTSGEILLNAIRLVLSGGVYIPQEMVNNSSPRSRLERIHTSEMLTIEEQATKMGLTPRQFDVICYLLGGRTNKIISWELGLSENTVKTHISNILKVLGVSNRSRIPITLENLGWDIKLLAK